jgi:hypothetical protein
MPRRGANSPEAISIKSCQSATNLGFAKYLIDGLFYLTAGTADSSVKRQVHKLRLRRNLDKERSDAAPPG